MDISKVIIKPENIEPTGNNLLLEIPEVQDDIKTNSGIILTIPDAKTKATPVIGLVLKAGDASIHKAGDYILFRRYAIDEMKFIDGEGEKKIFFLSDDEVLATVSLDEKEKELQ